MSGEMKVCRPVLDLEVTPLMLLIISRTARRFGLSLYLHSEGVTIGSITQYSDAFLNLPTKAGFVQGLTENK